MKQILELPFSWWFRTMAPAPGPLMTVQAREYQRKRRLFSILVLSIVLVYLLFTLQGFVVQAPVIQQGFNMLVCSAMILALWINQRGHLNWACAIYFSGTFIGGSLLLGSLSAKFPILTLCLWATIPLFLTVSGLLLPAWGPFLLSVVEIVFMWWYVFIEHWSYLAVYLKRSNGPKEFFFFACAIILFSAILGAIYSLTTKRAVMQADRADELEQAHLALSETHTELEVAHTLIKKQALTDELTGLPNHRAVMNQLTRELEQARRYGRSFSVLFFDADRFKQVNDTYGHAAGDAVLYEIGQRAVSALRSGDMLGRFGGEEFVILLPETAIAEAREVAERLRAVVASEPVATSEVTGGISMTVSIGLSTYQMHGISEQELLSRADEAMYMAKHEGRNQVRTADECRQVEVA